MYVFWSGSRKPLPELWLASFPPEPWPAWGWSLLIVYLFLSLATPENKVAWLQEVAKQLGTSDHSWRWQIQGLATQTHSWRRQTKQPEATKKSQWVAQVSRALESTALQPCLQSSRLCLLCVSKTPQVRVPGVLAQESEDLGLASHFTSNLLGVIFL